MMDKRAILTGGESNYIFLPPESVIKCEN